MTFTFSNSVLTLSLLAVQSLPTYRDVATLETSRLLDQGRYKSEPRASCTQNCLKTEISQIFNLQLVSIIFLPLKRSLSIWASSYYGWVSQWRKILLFCVTFQKTLLDNCGWTWFATPLFFYCSVESINILLHYLSPNTSSIHYNTLQCIKIAPKMHCYNWQKTVHFWCILNALQCNIVN